MSHKKHNYGKEVITIKISKKTIKRALRTFIQTAVGYAVINITAIDWQAEQKVMKSALTGMAACAISAGLAAVMNLEKGECEK